VSPGQAIRFTIIVATPAGAHEFQAPLSAGTKLTHHANGLTFPPRIRVRIALDDS
jgi:hypothetical protein